MFREIPNFSLKFWISQLLSWNVGSSLLLVSFSELFAFVLGKNCKFQSFSFLRFRDFHVKTFCDKFAMVFARIKHLEKVF